MYIQVPKIVPLNDILPDEPLLMMGAGPVPIPAAVAAANSIVINHLGDTISQIIEQVKAMARYLAGSCWSSTGSDRLRFI